MNVEYPDDRPLTPEEAAHLEHLKKTVQDALADGKLSQAERQTIDNLIYADRKVTVAELQTVRQAIRESLGDAALEYDWQP
ncbi:hypothetical protein [Nodosilinea sp. P-1105]|uniref:hypothetical protein n=1 Tax=Nodosilinea sp. P-1105 TaxID=2546229 RepID=UPI00146B2F1D|nr:hypothetical protein [Nodosilinea sp. P-1105]NMF82601.1 hypothetical protein [Nodosilinea sp. P-1105]